MKKYLEKKEELNKRRIKFNRDFNVVFEEMVNLRKVDKTKDSLVELFFTKPNELGMIVEIDKIGEFKVSEKEVRERWKISIKREKFIRNIFDTFTFERGDQDE